MDTETMTEIARDIETVWTDWVDEDVYDAATDAVGAVRALVAAIETNYYKEEV